MDDLELELKQLIISVLKLEEITATEIDSHEPLFGDSGLALDSIDALELGVALRKTYGLTIESANSEIRTHFSSVAALAKFVASHRQKATHGHGGNT